ncbi:hypothetical protein ACRCUN_02175 [Mycobacterium sp. LTG2003]
MTDQWKTWDEPSGDDSFDLTHSRGESDLDALGYYEPASPADTEDFCLDPFNGFDDVPESVRDTRAYGEASHRHQDDQEQPDHLQFSVTSPSGAATVTAFLGGAVRRIDLSYHVVNMSEAELAGEIMAVSVVATKKAQAGEYILVSELFRIQRQERTIVRELLEDRMRLSTPEEARRAAADLNSRYLRDAH